MKKHPQAFVEDELFKASDEDCLDVQEEAVDANDDILFEDDDDDAVCPHCASSPCEWIELGEAVIQQSDMIHHRVLHDGQNIVVDEFGVDVPNS
jgi:hypothetical protein